MNNNQLSDGTVIPSNLSANSSFDNKMVLSNNTALKLGYVSKIYYPTDKNNISKSLMEYDVNVVERFGTQSTNSTTYRNCYVNNTFGGINNHTDYTYQPNNEFDDENKNNGDLVLLLCLDGYSTGGNAIIIGGLSRSKKAYKTEDGQFYDFSFNGVKQKIDKDGQLTIAFTGAEDSKGNKVDANNTGTSLFIDKQGRFSIRDKEAQGIATDVIGKTMTMGNGESNIVIDKGNKSVSQTSSGKFSLDSKEEMKLNSSKTLDLMGKLDVNVESMASVSVRAKQNISFKSDARMQIQAGADITVQAGANVKIEASATAQITGTLTLLGLGTNPVAIAGFSQCLGYNAGGPMISTIITGSTSVLAGT